MWVLVSQLLWAHAELCHMHIMTVFWVFTYIVYLVCYISRKVTTNQVPGYGIQRPLFEQPP